MLKIIRKQMHSVTLVMLIAAIVSSLALMPIMAVRAASGENDAPLKTISISPNSYIKLKQAYMISGAHTNTVSFTLTVHNGDAADMQFLDYWVRLFTNTGAVYYPQLIAEQLNKKRISANSNEDFTFYATVGAAVKLQDLIFKAIKWDFNAPGFTRILGEISLPLDYSAAVPANSQQTIEGNGTVFSALVQKSALQKNEETYLARVTLALENMGTKNAALPDYHYSILTAEGVEYPLDVSGLSPGEQLLPKIGKEIELSGTLPAGVNLSQWKLLITSTETTSKLIIPIALFDLAAAIPEDTSSSAVDSGKIEVEKQAVTASVYGMTQTRNDDGYVNTLRFSLENMGNKKVHIPLYQFVLRTGEGLAYPLAAAGLENLIINPKQKKEIKLTVTIPFHVKMDQMKLEVYEPLPSGVDASKSKRIGTYLLPQYTSTEGGINQPIPYVNDSGAYVLNLVSVQRLPWQDQDLITAEISLQNKTASSLPVPELTGYYLIDGTVKVAARVIQPEQGAAIGGKSQKTIIVLGNLPYSYQFNSVKLILQEAGANQSKTSIAEFTYASELTKPKELKGTDVYELTDSGRKAKLSLNKVSTYTNSSSDMVYAEIQMENTEKRFTHLARLSGYFKTQDERYYPASISDIQQTISPNGSVLLSFWSKMPKGFKTEDLQLVIGEAITGNKTSAMGDIPDGFIKPVAFQRSEESNLAKSSLTNVDIAHYNASLSKIKASLGTNPGEIQLSFNYALDKKDNPYEAYPEGHKLVVEFESGNEKYNEELELETSASGKVLQLGSSNTHQIIITDPNLLTKITSFNTYTLRIYDKFQDHSRLLASGTFNWFTVSD